MNVVPFSKEGCLTPLFKLIHFMKSSSTLLKECRTLEKLDDGWPESEKDVFQAALSMVVVKDSR